MVPLKKPDLEVKLIHRQECEVIFLLEQRISNIEQGTAECRSKRLEGKRLDPKDRVIDFAVRIIRIADKYKSCQTKGQENFMIRNSLFDIRYSIFNMYDSLH